MKFEDYFDKETMSVHLREETSAKAKKGVPGKWSFIEINNNKLNKNDIEAIAEDMMEQATHRNDSFIESEEEGSTILQIGEHRTVITRPPFSDGWEITIVKPVKKLKFEEYKLSEKLHEKVESAEGLLIAGSPGEGKTTFARALAEKYSKGKIVKTVETPRDMLLSADITQYSLTRGNPEQIKDVLLLSRPDYTLFDEMRNTNDFLLFSDLRLAGIGMVGVVHATNPVDAIQRFMSRLELGVIPQVIDTVIYIKGGNVTKVLSLEMKVKVPSGMTEQDLARPVINVIDFETGKLEYEIYSYGEQTVMIPVQKTNITGAKKLAGEHLKNKLQLYASVKKVEIIDDNKARIYVPAHEIPSVIGKDGKNIRKMEQTVGMSLDVIESENEPEGQTVSFDVDIKKNITIYVDEPDKEYELYSNNEFLIAVKSSKKSQIKIKLKSPIGKRVQRIIEEGNLKVYLTP